MKLIHQEAVVLLDRIAAMQEEAKNMVKYQEEWGDFWGFSSKSMEKELAQKLNEIEEYKTRYNLLILKLTKL